MQLYPNPNALDVDSFASHRDGTKGQLQRNGDGNCEVKNADIGYESTPVFGLGWIIGIHLGTHLVPARDSKCLRGQGFESLVPLLL
jgi:hypothetical protein